MFISIMTHGALGVWDEVVYVVGALLFTAAIIVVWRVGRRFKPVLQQEKEPPNTPDQPG